MLCLEFFSKEVSTRLNKIHAAIDALQELEEHSGLMDPHVWESVLSDLYKVEITLQTTSIVLSNRASAMLESKTAEKQAKVTEAVTKKVSLRQHAGEPELSNEMA